MDVTVEEEDTPAGSEKETFQWSGDHGNPENVSKIVRAAFLRKKKASPYLKAVKPPRSLKGGVDIHWQDPRIFLPPESRFFDRLEGWTEKLFVRLSCLQDSEPP